MSLRRRRAFQPCLDTLPSRIAPTVFTPPPDLSTEIGTPCAVLVATPTTLATPSNDPGVMTTPDCPL